MSNLNPVIVNTYSGKQESVDTVTVRVFANLELAVAYLVDIPSAESQRHNKYWYYAEIVQNGEQIELTAPRNI